MSALLEIKARAVVFDAVGTLIAPAVPVAETYAAVARREGVEVSPRLIASRFRRALQRLDRVDGRTNEQVERDAWRSIVSECLPEVADASAAFEALWRHYARPESWTVYSDVQPALANLAAGGVRLGVASNFDARLRAVVRGHPELTLVENQVWVCSELGYRKPAPEFFWEVARELGLRASDVLYVGDDAAHDAEAPRAIGMQACLLRRGAATGDFGGSIETLMDLRVKCA